MRSTLFPGWGQFATQHRRLGRVLVTVSGLVVVGFLTVFLFTGPMDLPAELANPDVLLAVVAVNLFIAALRLFSTTHAWWAGGGHRWLAALLLVSIVTIPHAAVAWMGLEARASLLTVFPDDPVVVAGPISTTTSSSSTTTTTVFEIEPVPFGTAPGEYAEDPIDLDNRPVWQPFGSERLNFLLLGGDAGPGRSGLRTDTMIVASVDPITGDAALIGVPRNFGGFTFTDGTPFTGKILNSVYDWGRKNPDAFGGTDPGASAIMDVVENLTALDIDYFMLVDLTGFADLIDVLGGVQIAVPLAVDGPLYDPVTGGYEMVQIPAGDQHLDGGHALAYARARYGSSDYVRMGRQRCILASMADQADLLTLITSLPRILDVVETHLTTDIPLDTVPDLIRLSQRISSEKMRVLGFDYTWRVGYTPDGYAIPDVERIRVAVRQIIENPDASTDDAVRTAAASCQ